MLHIYPQLEPPPALLALMLDGIPMPHVHAFLEAAAMLKKGLEPVGMTEFKRPPAQKRGRGAAMDSLGKLSTPHTSRRVLQTKDKLMHLDEAIEKGFPSSDDRGERPVDEDIINAVRFAMKLGPKKLTRWRRDQQELLRKCKRLLQPLNEWILHTAKRGTAAKHVAPNPDIALIACITHAMEWPDVSMAADFCYGFPLLGTMQDQGLFRPLEQVDARVFETERVTPILATNVVYITQLVADLKAQGEKLKADDKTALALDETTRVEREEKGVLGEEFDLVELYTRFPKWKDKHCREHTAVRPSPRFANWQKQAVRAIDDYKRSLINFCLNPAETIAPPSAIFPIEVMDVVARTCDEMGVPLPAMHLGLDDVAHAYKRCAVLQREFGVLCYWNHAKRKVVFCEQWGLPFGAVASVTGFCRLPHLLTRFARTFFAASNDHFIDDNLQPDFVDAGDSAQQAIGALFKSVGIPFSDKKRQHPATTQDELGITCIMDNFASHRTATVTPRAERCDFIREELRKCEEANRLTPGLAKELFGKLSFCLQSLFGRVGRASALPLLKRCYDSTNTSFDNELKEMRQFFDLVLAKHNLPSRTFRLGTPARLPVILYSDACDKAEYRGLGLVCHDMEEPDTGRFYAADVCPAWLLDKIHEDCPEGAINPLEMLAAVNTILTMRSRLRGRRVVFYIDNTSAWSAMIQGYTSSRTMAKISALFHLALAALDIDCWIEWVNSDANIADWPSRPQRQRAPFYAIRPVFKQTAMVFPTEEDMTKPIDFFNRLRDEAN